MKDVLELPDYLWGIETIIFDPYQILAAASRLPMRNWNSWKNFANVAASLPSFQTTYEELKPPSSGALCRSARLPDYLWGIETPCKPTLPSRTAASRLPMRNWNHLEGPITKVLPKLPDYLWGIETVLCSRVSAVVVVASRLPMRNWNFQHTDAPIFWVFASRLPMRNWNASHHLCALYFDIASRLPMRNWNTAVFMRTVRFRPASRLPMRNWNTLLLTTQPVVFLASRLPMRNWNQWKDRSWMPHNHCFQTTYEELKLRVSPRYRVVLPGFQTTYEELKLDSHRL